MKNYFLALSLVASASAFADFNGSISGTGALSSNIGMALACEDIHFTLTQNAQTATMSGSVNCGEGFKIDYEQTTMDIVNGRLIYNGQDVGSISSDSIRIAYRETDENGQPIDLTTNFTKKGNIVQFEQGFVSPLYSLSIKGDLK